MKKIMYVPTYVLMEKLVILGPTIQKKGTLQIFINHRPTGCSNYIFHIQELITHPVVLWICAFLQCPFSPKSSETWLQNLFYWNVRLLVRIEKNTFINHPVFTAVTRMTNFAKIKVQNLKICLVGLWLA